MTTTQLDIEVLKAIALDCAAGCGQEIAIHQQSASRFVGHHRATAACDPEAQHWHMVCEPKRGMHYLSSERSQAGK